MNNQSMTLEEFKKEGLEWIPIKAAANYLNRSTNSVRNYIKDGTLQSRQGTSKYGNITEVSINEVELLFKKIHERTQSPFGNIKRRYGESFIPLDIVNNPWDKQSPKGRITSKKYFVSNYGRVFNFSDNRELEQSKASHGYLQVGLAVHGEEKFERVHRLVAYLWCDNRKLKECVHHIDGNIKNNRADNLIFVTQEQHTKADNLLKKAKETQKGSTKWKTYKKYISHLRHENKLTERQIKSSVRWVYDGNGSFLLFTNSGFNFLESLKPDVRDKMLEYAKGLEKEDQENFKELMR